MTQLSAPFPPVPPDALAIQRKRCSICRNKVMRPVIDAALDKGVSAAQIAREITAMNWPIGYIAVSRHRQHYVSAAPVTPGSPTRKADLAEVVRDRTLQAIEDGRLDITDDSWKNVAPGLKAQDIIDKRDRTTDTAKALLGFARMLVGAGAVVFPPEVSQVSDGLTIEGDFTELSEPPDA